MSKEDTRPQGAYLALSKDEIRRRLDYHRRFKFHFQQFINGECLALETRMNRLKQHHPDSRDIVNGWIRELKLVRLARDTRRLEEIQDEYRVHTNQTGMWTLDL